MAEKSALPIEKVKELFCNEVGYQTPKLGTRAAIFKDEKILLVQENDGTWSIPGGWCKVDLSVKENVIKEIKEEAGIDITVERLIAIYDSNKHYKGMYPYGITTVFFLCKPTGGSFTENDETIASGYFALDNLPELSEDKGSKEQVETYHNPNWQAEFEQERNIMQRREIETELGKINYAYRKGDPLVVFLNGFGSFDTGQSFSKVIESLPNEYGYFAPDYLNSGFSGKSLKDYTVADEATELAKIINDFKAEKIIILVHSIGGVYAMQMKDKINNLKAFVGIEPTTREIMLNPPKEPAYIEKNKNMAKLQEKIEADLREIFAPEENKKFWTTTEQNAKKFDEKDNLNAQAAYENDSFWKDTTRISDKTPSVLITEKYRENEYKRSEYVSNNSKSEVVTLGDSHYIHFEYPKKIAEIVKEVIDF